MRPSPYGKWLDAWFIPWMVLFVGALWLFGSI